MSVATLTTYSSILAGCGDLYPQGCISLGPDEKIAESD